MRYSTSCDDIMLYNFDKICKTDDLRYMVMTWDKHEEIEIDEPKARENWEKIFDDYIVMKDDNKTTMYYNILSDLRYLLTRKDVVERLLNQMTTQSLKKEMFKQYIKALSKWGFYFDKKLPYNEALKKLYKQLKLADNKINIKKAELENFKSKDVGMSLVKQIVKVEQALGRNMIDPEKTSMSKWHALTEEIKEQSSGRRKSA